MMSCNFLRMVLLGNARNIAKLDNILRSGLRAFRFGLGLALTAIALTTVAASQLTATPPLPNTASVYVGDTTSFAVTASGQQGAVAYIWQFSINGAPYVPLNDGLQASGSTISGSSSSTLVITSAQSSDTGRYRCLVSDSASNINSGPASLTVTLPPLPNITTPPSDQTVVDLNPANFTVSAEPAQTKLTYQWQVSSPAGVTFINVNEDGVRILGSTKATLQIAKVQLSDAGWYRCLVTDAAGTTNSGRATLATLASPPANLTTTAVSSTGVNVTWTNTDISAPYVVIERQTLAPATPTAFALLVEAAAQTASYQDLLASPQTTYNYRAYAIYAIDAVSGTHAYSNQSSATTMAPTLPPTGFLATPATSTQINLSWGNQDPTANQLIIERQALTTGAGTPFVQIASLPGQYTAYQDTNNGTGLPVQTAFNYRAYAVSPRGNSVYSNTSETTTLAPPPTPLSFQATDVSSNEIDLSWNNSDPTVQSYVIERQAVGGVYSQIATVAPVSNHSYHDTTVMPATQYNYRMYAQSPTGASAYTDPVSATTVPAPPTPTHIDAIPVSATQIDVSWKNPPGNFTIQIERKKAENPPFGEIGTVDTSAPPIFHDQHLDPATTYFYQVRACDAAGSCSPYSTLAITSTLVPSPTNLSSTGHTAPAIELQWTNAFNGYTKLHLYQNGPNDLVRFLVADLAGNATSYTFDVALPNTSYSFTLQAEVSGKLSAFTSDLVVTAQGQVTIFFVHGTGQGGGDLDGLAAAVQSSIDPNGNTYIFDAGFDWSRCTKTGGIHQRFPPTPLPAGEDLGVVPPPPPLPFFPLIPGFPPNPCPNDCVVTAGAVNLAKYIASKNPPGDVFIIAYSLGGNVARDMIEGQPGSHIGTPGHKLLGLVTLGTGNNGYPYEYPWDNAAICDGIAKEIASDTRTSPASYPYNGQYIQSINNNWLASPLGGAGYQSFPWLVAAGTFCKSPIRFPDSTQNGCSAGSSNDGIVCADSALLNGVPGGNFNRPTSIFASDLYSHTADNDPITQFFVFDENSNGDRSAFYNGHCNMPDHMSLWNPGAGSSLAQQLANFIQANTP
ncbi:MAG: immunoglobulin domain-containing protein [Candidatus Angelobacter sp.]